MSAQLNLWSLKFLNPDIPDVRGGLFDEWARRISREEKERQYELRRTLSPLLSQKRGPWSSRWGGLPLFAGRFYVEGLRRISGARPCF